MTAVREKIDDLPTFINLFGGKAYLDKQLTVALSRRNIELFMPFKKPKKQCLSPAQKLFNKTVSTYREPIESFFKWLIDKIDIQRAISVRSFDGLLIHCIDKLTFALFLLNFYYSPHTLYQSLIPMQAKKLKFRKN